MTLMTATTYDTVPEETRSPCFTDEETESYAETFRAPILKKASLSLLQQKHSASDILERSR